LGGHFYKQGVALTGSNTTGPPCSVTVELQACRGVLQTTTTTTDDDYRHQCY